MRYAIAISVLLLALTADLDASEPIPERDYASFRTRSITRIPFATIAADPSSYIGKIFELRGRVTGIFRSSEGGTMVITPESGSSQLVGADELPVQGPGAELACLVKVGEGCTHSLSDLRLVACTYDADLRRLEAAWQADAARVKAAAAQKQKAAAEAASGGGQGAGPASSEQIVAAYKKAVKRFNPKLSDTQADTIARSILGFSARYQVDARLVCAVILAESNFRINATSSCGAQGLGQLMPGTAAGLGVNNAYDPVENVYGSVRYVKSMLDRVSGSKHWNELTWNDLALALASYNAGPGAVKKHGGIPPYRETHNYVRKVVSIYKQLCGVS